MKDYTECVPHLTDLITDLIKNVQKERDDAVHTSHGLSEILVKQTEDSKTAVANMHEEIESLKQTVELKDEDCKTLKSKVIAQSKTIKARDKEIADLQAELAKLRKAQKSKAKPKTKDKRVKKTVDSSDSEEDYKKTNYPLLNKQLRKLPKNLKI